MINPKHLWHESEIIPYLQWVKSNPKASKSQLIYSVNDTFSKSFAKNIIDVDLCQANHPEDLMACDRCRPCLWRIAENHPDFYRIKLSEDQRLIGIDQIRVVNDRLSRKPLDHHRHIVLVEGAERLSISANNALLKTLEESPAQALILLLAISPRNMLATIKSRCEEIHLPSPSMEDFDHFLLQNYPDIERYNRNLLALVSGYCPDLVAEIVNSNQLESHKIWVNHWLMGKWDLEMAAFYSIELQLEVMMRMTFFCIYYIMGLPSYVQSRSIIDSSGYWLFWQALMEVKSVWQRGVSINEKSLIEPIVFLWQNLAKRDHWSLIEI